MSGDTVTQTVAARLAVGGHTDDIVHVTDVAEGTGAVIAHSRFLAFVVEGRIVVGLITPDPLHILLDDNFTADRFVRTGECDPTNEQNSYARCDRSPDCPKA